MLFLISVIIGASGRRLGAFVHADALVLLIPFLLAGNVAYLYSVFLCKSKGATFRALAKMGFGSCVHEPGGDKECGYVVVRQPTSGTATTPRTPTCAARTPW